SDASSAGTSRRDFLKSGAGFVAGGAAAETLAGDARAQNGGSDGGAQVKRRQSARPIVLKGAIVLRRGRQGGDFAPADILIEDGKIRDVRPNIVTGNDVAVLDVTNRIVIPGFVDTHSHSFEGVLRSTLPNGTIFDPGYRETFEDRITRNYQPDDVHI